MIDKQAVSFKDFFANHPTQEQCKSLTYDNKIALQFSNSKLCFKKAEQIPSSNWGWDWNWGWSFFSTQDKTEEEQCLFTIMNIIQFTRWKNGIWEKDVLSNLIKHFGEETFTNTCKALLSIQLKNLKHKDSNIKETFYYDVRTYSPETVKAVKMFLKEICKNQNMCIHIPEEGMRYVYTGYDFKAQKYCNPEEIINNGMTGNGLPLFADNVFIGFLKEINKNCYQQLVELITDKDFFNALLWDAFCMHGRANFYKNQNNRFILLEGFEDRIPKYMKSFADSLLLIAKEREPTAEDSPVLFNS